MYLFFLSVCFCLCRKSCSPLPFWCLLLSAFWDPSTSVLSSPKPKIKLLWTSVGALPGSTKRPVLHRAMKLSWLCPLHLTRMAKRRRSQKWKVCFSRNTIEIQSKDVFLSNVSNQRQCNSFFLYMLCRKEFYVYMNYLFLCFIKIISITAFVYCYYALWGQLYWDKLKKNMW